MTAGRSTSETATAMPPMSVCFFISHFWPVASGAENQAFEQGKELVRRGHRVHVLTRAIPRLARDEERDGLQIHRWIRPWELGPAFGASFVVQGARALWRLRRQFQVVHAHQGLWEAAAAGAIRRWLGRPVLVQPAAGGWDGEVQTLMRTRGRRLLRRLILKNDHFAAISQQIADELTGLGASDEDRLTLTVSGVDTERFSPGPSALEATLPPRPRVLFVGRLHPQKNLAMLLHAWRDVVRCEERGRARPVLLLAGDGPERETLRRTCGELGIGESVRFLGPVDHVEECYRACDVFVLPSRAEGSPNALLEAMSSGLACAVSNIGGNTDLVRGGERGIVLPADAPDAWAETLRRLLGDAEERRRLGASACRWIAAHRSLPRVVDRYEATYRRLLGK